MNARSADEAQVIAALAVHLLPTGTPDASDVTAAVQLASRLMEEASKPAVKNAYEFFPRNAEMNMAEIAKIFEDHKWAVLTSRGTVLKYVGQLLDSMYRNIQVRRSLLATALRQRERRVDPGDEARVAGVVIKNLLRDLGMDTAFGLQLDDAVGRIWHDIVDIWLKTDQQLKRDLVKIPSVSPSLFSDICVDSSYEQYAAARRPPDGLGTDGLLSVILWLDGTFRKQLAKSGDIDGSLNTLSMLDRWPEYLCPGERRFSNPFAECITELAKSAEERDGLLEKFERGVQRYGGIWARLMLMEFSKKCTAEPATQRLQEIVRAWNELESGKKAEIGESFYDDPARVVGCVVSFLQGEMPLSLTTLQFHGSGILTPALRPYARELDSLLLGLREVSELARRLNISEDYSQEIKDAIRAEKTRISEMGTVLADPDKAATQERVSFGGRVIQGLKPPSSLGRINPHLLFRYAYDNKLLDDLLVKL